MRHCKVQFDERGVFFQGLCDSTYPIRFDCVACEKKEREERIFKNVALRWTLFPAEGHTPEVKFCEGSVFPECCCEGLCSFRFDVVP